MNTSAQTYAGLRLVDQIDQMEKWQEPITHVCVNAVVFDQDEILVGRRKSRDSHAPGALQCIFGGYLNPSIGGPKENLLEELKEEIGLTEANISDGYFCGTLGPQIYQSRAVQVGELYTWEKTRVLMNPKTPILYLLFRVDVKKGFMPRASSEVGDPQFLPFERLFQEHGNDPTFRNWEMLFHLRHRGIMLAGQPRLVPEK